MYHIDYHKALSEYNNTCMYIKPATQHLLEFILMQYTFNSIDEQAARIIHATAKSTAIVVDEIAQSAEYYTGYNRLVSKLIIIVT